MNTTYFVYIIANATRVLYIGITNNLHKRFWVHREKLCKGFTSNFHLCRLVYYESFDDVRNAINREKQLKRWRREKKIALIESLNRDWRDLSDGWYSGSKVQGLAPRLAKSARSG
jgi:putative endonuclease